MALSRKERDLAHAESRRRLSGRAVNIIGGAEAYAKAQHDMLIDYLEKLDEEERRIEEEKASCTHSGPQHVFSVPGGHYYEGWTSVSCNKCRYAREYKEPS